MLKKITLYKYKCFKKYTIEFKNENILVGANNAGKTTIGEAIRLISLATSSYKTAKYRDNPGWLKLEPISEKGYTPSYKRIDLTFENSVYQYDEDIAVITGEFDNNTKVKIFINNFGDYFIKVYDKKLCIKNNQQAKKVDIPLIKSMPSLKPLLKEEKYMDIAYVNNPYNEKNYSLHLRNKIYDAYKNRDKYDEFLDAITDTWPGIKVEEIFPENYKLYLHVLDREAEFVTEISNFGDGLQIWLQMIFYINSLDKNTIVFLDEPDVYLHADLQNKLYKLIHSKFEQFIIATHSIEIINSAKYSSLIEINKKERSSCTIDSTTELNNIITALGSNINIKLISIINEKKVLYFEGDDFDYIKKIASKISKMSEENINIPILKLGGRGIAKEKITSLQSFTSNQNNDIKITIFLDNDYFQEKENEELFNLARKANINLHIWKRKELENYFCDINIIKKALKNDKISDEKIEEIVFRVTDSMKDDLIHSMLDLKCRYNKKLTPATVLKEISKEVNDNWDNFDYKITKLPGKKILSNLFSVLKLEYNISLSINKILHNIEVSDINNELKNAIGNFLK